MIPSRTIPLFLASCLPAIAGSAKSPASSSGDWEFSLSAGVGWRHSGSIDFTGGSRQGAFPIPSFVGDAGLTTPQIGAENAFGERFYDDGFVRLDSSTAIDGLTSHWGYENASQVDVAGDTIRFRATGFESIRNDMHTFSNPPSASSRERSLAPVLQFNARHKRETSGFRPGLSVLFSWNPVRFDRQWTDFSLLQTREDFRTEWTDAFNLGGFGSLVPSAPYAGEPDSPGFLLENLPDSRTMVTVPIGLEEALVGNRVTTRFRADHTTLSLGPTLTHELNPQWNLEAGIGVSLHWLRWSARQNEQWTATQEGTRTVISEWNDASSGNRILAGAYLQIAAEWMPDDKPWSIQGMLRLDRGQSMSRQIGPSQLRYDADGMMMALMWRHPL